MEDRKKMHQFPSKPGASKEGKCLFVSSVFISVIKNASAVIASHSYELAKNDVDFVLKLFACLRFFFSLDIFFSLGIFKQKQSLYCLFCQHTFLELSGCEYMHNAVTQRFGIPFILISANIFFHQVSILPHKCIIYLCIHQCNLLSPCYKIWS